MFKELKKYLIKPELYAPDSGMFWRDEHISGMLLDVHLDPDHDSATRKHEFVDKSVKWITEIAPPSEHPQLLDLGCGPGLYTERFYDAGYTVTGIDFSERSIKYAGVEAALGKKNIEYIHQDYLTIDFIDSFNVITLIYCDYAALSATNRKTLLGKIYKALKPGGKFIVDVFTHKMRQAESRSWYYSESGGFFCDKEHLYMDSIYQYDDDDKTELRQIIIVNDESVYNYNVWDHYFNKDELIDEIMPAGFDGYELFDDIAGKEYTGSGETICGVFVKEGL